MLVSKLTGKGILEMERGSTRSHSVENSLWKSLWACRKTDYVMNGRGLIFFRHYLWNILHDAYFFCGEGPRSRCYGRTTALRLIVQSCDEGDQFFSVFFV
jgi:hypothetical protein